MAVFNKAADLATVSGHGRFPSVRSFVCPLFVLIVRTLNSLAVLPFPDALPISSYPISAASSTMQHCSCWRANFYKEERWLSSALSYRHVSTASYGRKCREFHYAIRIRRNYVRGQLVSSPHSLSLEPGNVDSRQVEFYPISFKRIVL